MELKTYLPKMNFRLKFVLLGTIIAVLMVSTKGLDPDLEQLECEGRKYIKTLDIAVGRQNNREALAYWDYQNNMTEWNFEFQNNVSLEIAKEIKKAWEETNTYKWQDFQDQTLRRMFMKYSHLGEAALPNDKYTKLMTFKSKMVENYAKSKVCDYKNTTKCDLSLDPEITNIFATSTNPEELKHLWVQWHKEAGAKVRNDFIKYIELSNEAAKTDGFKNRADQWLSEYDAANFEEQMEKIWTDIKPLYQQLHAYVRKRLRDKYGDKIVSSRGPFPAHLLGNMWAQNWEHIESFTLPYPDKEEIDVTQAMKEQNYTPLKMFQMAEEFYLSLNLTAMPEKFWKNSVIEKPTDREIVCHASAWDFYDGKDFRIKMCTNVNAEDFQTIHHEMGHVEYYLQYKNQPNAFKEGANPGFHEAIGDTIGLSVASPKHLRQIGLHKEHPEDEQTEINQLYRMSIQKIVLIPFAYLLDLWRYGIYRGTTTPEDYNCHYWKLREAIQGVEPPVNRTEEDFDPAAKYHVSADVEYARYYIAAVIQFQFHRTLCQLAREYVPEDSTKKLVDCDIYRSVTAGNALANMMKMGSSRPWPDAMEVLTGQREMRSDGLLEYFKPLYEWLKCENLRTGEYVGWEPSKMKYCTTEQEVTLETNKPTPAPMCNI